MTQVEFDFKLGYYRDGYAGTAKKNGWQLNAASHCARVIRETR
jgi:hypothetical protein